MNFVMKKRSVLLPIFASFFWLILLSAAMPARAQEDGNGGNPEKISITLQNPFKVGNNLYEVAKGIVNNVILRIGGVLCVLAFIYSGFLYVTAGGSDTKINQAHKALLNSAIGTALLLGAWVLVTLVQTTIDSLLKP